MRRQEWCRSKRGRVIIIGWGPVIVREIGAEIAALAQENATVTSKKGTTNALCHASSYVETPD
jgi:hypothetical protein